MLSIFHAKYQTFQGDDDLGQRDVCEFVADIFDCIFDSPGEEASLEQWNELILKVPIQVLSISFNFLYSP